MDEIALLVAIQRDTASQALQYRSPYIPYFQASATETIFCPLYHPWTTGHSTSFKNFLTKYNSLETLYLRNMTKYFLTHVSELIDADK